MKVIIKVDFPPKNLLYGSSAVFTSLLSLCFFTFSIVFSKTASFACLEKSFFQIYFCIIFKLCIHKMYGFIQAF